MKKRSTFAIHYLINKVHAFGLKFSIRRLHLFLLLSFYCVLSTVAVEPPPIQEAIIVDGYRCESYYETTVDASDPFNDTPTGSADIGDMWFGSGPEASSYFYFSFARESSGNSGFAIYFKTNTDEPANGDSSYGYANIAVFTQIKNGGVETKTIYEWNSGSWNPTTEAFIAEVGSNNCDKSNVNGDFIEFAIPYSSIGDSIVCEGLDFQVTYLAAYAGNFTSTLKDTAPIDPTNGTFHINFEPLFSGNIIRAPEGDICIGQSIIIGATIYDGDGMPADSADFREAYQVNVDPHYEGGVFTNDPGAAIISATPRAAINDTVFEWDIEILHEYMSPGTYDFRIQVLDPWGCSLDVISDQELITILDESVLINYTKSDVSCEGNDDGTLSITASPLNDDTKDVLIVVLNSSGDTIGNGSNSIEIANLFADNYLIDAYLLDNLGNPTGCLNSGDVLIEVFDTNAPVITTAAFNKTVECDGNGNSTELSTWLNSHGGAIGSDQGTITWSYLPSTPVLSNLCGSTGEIEVTFRATDNCGLYSETVATFTIEDTTDPVWATAPSDKTVECDGTSDPSGAFAAWLTSFSGTDACGTATVSHNSSGLSNGCGATGSETVTFTLTDACGNSISEDATFTIEDTTDPTLSCPEDLTMQCDESSDPSDTGLAIAIDNCDNNPVVSYSDNIVSGTSSQEYIIERTWKALDSCGNESTCLQRISVVDDTSPVIETCALAKETFADGNCEAIVPDYTEEVDALDNCTDTEFLTITQSPIAGSIATIGTTVVTITVSDEAGNSTTCNANFTVTDNTPPSFTCNDIIVELDENNQYTISEDDLNSIVTDLQDNCNAIGEITISLDPEFFTCENIGEQQAVVTVMDAESNTSTCDVTVTVVDTILPTISCAEDVVATIQSNGSCTGFVNVSSPDVDDNCGITSVINDFNNSSNASGNYPTGETVVSWTVTDHSGNTAICTQIINVISNPEANSDNRTTAEDTPITIAVLENDFDCDDELINNSLQLISDPANGVAVVNSNGTVTYTPNENYYGSDQFSYRICDSDEQCDNANVNITIISSNDPPVAVDDLNNTFVNVTTPGNVLTNDYDVDGNRLTAVLLSNPEHGTLVFNEDGTYTYTPTADFLGEDIFSYQVEDGQGGSAIANVYITVISDHSTQNQSPVANEDVYIGKENTVINGNVLENDYDPDGDPLVVNTELIIAPSVGAVQLDQEGNFTYTPPQGYTGEVYFTYDVCDDFDPSACNTALVILIIDPNANSNITVAVDDAFFTKVNSTLTADLSLNDYDPEGDETAIILNIPANHGEVELATDGTFTYIPNIDYIGPDHFSYQVCDNGLPMACDQATVYINVSEVNHPPVAVDDWFNQEDGTANILENDYDPDGDEIVLNTTLVTSVKYGTLVINPDGSFNYTPNPLSFEQDTFTYQICDNALVPLCDQAIVVLYLDSDGDGVANTIDIDDDNDGILDIEEGDQLVDTDNDGIPDSLDIDSDNDGITDNQESQNEENYIAPVGKDTDGDGWDDAYDDTNGGSPIVIVDTDKDGIYDYLDQDSDNDGITDAVEGHDANHDGVSDVLPSGIDSDGDGLDDAYDTVNRRENHIGNVTGSNAPMDNTDGDKVSDWRDIDSDNDGLTDGEEVAQVADPDGDGLANYLDIDSDGDGITDNEESQSSNNKIIPSGQDADGDGLDDAYDSDNGGELLTALDTDLDGIPDFIDADSDNDSVPDEVEAHDADGDGIADILPAGQDSDGDGLDDAYDSNNDFNDPLNVIGVSALNVNSDDDDVLNWRDIDDDNDGILTEEEADNSSDNDNDGIIDYLDIDSDNDGIVDNIEGQDDLLSYIEPSGIDTDGDGLDDVYDTDIGGIVIGNTDSDGDGIPDYLDEDSDNDYVPDYIESQDMDKNGKPDIDFMGVDSDGDGLDDSNDSVRGRGIERNSVGTNVPLPDSDGDGIPDWRDTDDDGDGIETSLKEDDNGDGDPTNDDCNYNGIPNYLDEESCDLLIPDAFSPNGDGINDHFRIRGMYKYPNAKIEIYNRWGAVVYTKENYGNITMYGDPDAWWDGRANSKGTSGSEILPTGTYFVVLILENSFVHKGIVYINR